MARLPRLYIPGFPQLMLQRGVGATPIWRDERDARLLLDALDDGARGNELAIHAWALLPDQLFLLATPKHERSGARTLQAVGRRYVNAFNRRYGRAGTLWEGRYRSTVIDPDDYFLQALRFVESRPLAARLVTHAEQWRWSSYAHHIGLANDPMVLSHPKYWALANGPFERQAAYKAMFDEPLAFAAERQIAAALEQGWMLASEQAGIEHARAASRRPHPTSRGRPRKTVP